MPNINNLSNNVIWKYFFWWKVILWPYFTSYFQAEKRKILIELTSLPPGFIIVTLFVYMLIEDQTSLLMVYLQ